MSKDFNSPDDEIRHLSGEIAFLRKELQSANTTLNRLEKRLKVAFPNYPDKTKSTVGKKSKSSQASSVKSEDELQSDFSRLVNSVKVNGDIGFETFFSEYLDEDTLALSHELGATSKSASVKKAKEGIKSRAQESMLLLNLGKTKTPKSQ